MDIQILSSDMRCNRRHQSCVFVNERRSAEWMKGRSRLEHRLPQNAEFELEEDRQRVLSSS